MKSENRTKPKANAAKLIELTKFLATKLPGGAWAYKERERVRRGVRGCPSVGPGSCTGRTHSALHLIRNGDKHNWHHAVRPGELCAKGEGGR